MSPTFPAIRACIFDVDGLLINSEDVYTEIYNNILREYSRPEYPWIIKATQQSRGTPGTLRLLKWANIPLSLDEWKVKEKAHEHLFSKCEPLPGAVNLLETLSQHTSPPVKIALASSAGRRLFEVKTSHISGVSSAFNAHRQVFGDDADMASCSKKPSPEIFLLALKRINEMVTEMGEHHIKPEQCLVFEDSIAGVEAGRRAGMRVVWVPHPGLAAVCVGKEQKVLAGSTEMHSIPMDLSGVGQQAGEQVRLSQGESLKSDDGWAEMRMSLENFPYEQYGIRLTP